jgi:hypothetical protein
LEALLANLRGKERGSGNENASNLVYFASFGILAGLEIYKSIFRIFLDLKLVLEYFFNIKRYKNKKILPQILWCSRHSDTMPLSDSLTLLPSSHNRFSQSGAIPLGSCASVFLGFLGLCKKL